MLVDRHADKGEAKETRAPIGNIALVLGQLAEVLNAGLDPSKVTISQAFLNVQINEFGGV